VVEIGALILWIPAKTADQDDSDVLFRAGEYLLDEWVLSLGAERSNAQRELESILRGDRSEESMLV